MILFAGCNRTQRIASDHIPLNDGWTVQSSEGLESEGQTISTTAFDSKDWYKAQIPATVFAVLRQNNLHSDIFMADNMDKVDRAPFQKPWWYRKSFNIEKNKNTTYQLQFEGINYKADIWINGTQVESFKTVEGPFGRWNIDVSDNIANGENIVAIKVYPPQKGDLTIGFVDWNPAAPDNNMGLWRGVYLKESGNISLESPFVQTRLTSAENDQAELTVSVFATNHSDKATTASITVSTPNLFSVTRDINLEAGQTREIIFTSEENPSLRIKNPQLWWPVNMGEATLHTLMAEAKEDGNVSDCINSQYGIRQIEQYLTERGDKGFKINGKPTLIKGGGWVDDVFLADDDSKVKAQVEYVRHMNLNTIRLEGFWGKNKTLFEECDKNGILLMIGWSCQWEWEAYCGRPETPFMSITGHDEMVRNTRAYVDQVKYLRNHPSVFLWVFGSDKLPLPQLEKMLNDEIGKVDPSRPLLASCKNREVMTPDYFSSEVSGPVGVKMLGPYNYVPPVYWYVDTIAGGAYGFNTETGPGPQVTPLESIKKMIPEDKLWPINDMWNYHCGRHEFGSLDGFLKSFDTRYGKADDLETFAFKTQISNYEAMRPMFEAFQVNHGKSTGVIQWMLNSAWPEFYWQLYDYFLMPNGAFYGAKKGCQPLNIVYHYGENSIYVVNERLTTTGSMKATIRLFDISSKEIYNEMQEINMEAESVKLISKLPSNLRTGKTYFASLKLTDLNDNVVADNFYWLSSKPDVMDWNKTTWVNTPMKGYADLTGINKLPQVTINSTMEQSKTDDGQQFKVKLENPNPSIAFFTELTLLDEETGQTLLPVFWSDNYVSLTGNETKELTATIANEIIGNKRVALRVKGWNVN
jgi:exo-1,4-beta-D-glucosaminidase